MVKYINKSKVMFREPKVEEFTRTYKVEQKVLYKDIHFF